MAVVFAPRGPGWIDSNGPRPGWWHYLAVLLPVPVALMIEITWLVGPVTVMERLAFYPTSDVQGSVLVWTLGVIVPAIAVIVTLNLRRQWIRVDDFGIEAKSFLRVQRVKWDELRWLSPVYKDRIALSYYRAGPLYGSHGWLGDLTRCQATSLFDHPKMPSKLLTPTHIAWAHQAVGN